MLAGCSSRRLFAIININGFGNEGRKSVTKLDGKNEIREMVNDGRGEVVKIV
jgi:hypothetical protein